MKQSNEFKVGQTIVYNDGRPGHAGVKAIILSIVGPFLFVQFEDRADTTTINTYSPLWMDYITTAND